MASQSLAVKYTLGVGFVNNPYHVRVIQSSLTRSINPRFGEIQDEISTAFQDEIPQSEGTVVRLNYYPFTDPT